MNGRRAGSGRAGRPRVRWGLIAACWLACPALGLAQEGGLGSGSERGGGEGAAFGSSMGFGFGYYDVGGPYPALHVGLDYRSVPKLGPLRIWAQGEVTTDRSAGVFAGLMAEIPVGERIALTPRTGVGAWHVGDGKPLGSSLEFRSTAEATYDAGGGRRVGLALGHISNAGFGSTNPGVNVLALMYVTPIGRVRSP